MSAFRVVGRRALRLGVVLTLAAGAGAVVAILAPSAHAAPPSTTQTPQRPDVLHSVTVLSGDGNGTAVDETIPRADALR